MGNTYSFYAVNWASASEFCLLTENYVYQLWNNDKIISFDTSHHV